MFIRYNETTHIWEYDSSVAKAGGGPWLILPNIPFLDHANTFTQDQTISEANPVLLFNESGGTANQRKWKVVGFGGNLYFQPVNDANSATNQSILLYRNGDVFTAGSYSEYNRTTPMGSWISFTPVFAVNAGTIVVNSILTCKYTLVGKTFVFAFTINITLSSTPSSVTINIPGGFVSAVYGGATFLCGAPFIGLLQTAPATGAFYFYRDLALTPWPAGTYYILGNFTFEIQ